MQLSIDELREMIREAINQQVLEEGPFADRLAQYQNASQNIIDKYRSRTDAVVSRGSQTSTPTAAPAAPTAPISPAIDPGDLEDTEPIRPAEPIDPEDMIEPTQPPAASEDASLKTIFDISRQIVKDGDITEIMDTAFRIIAGLLALNKTPTAEEMLDAIAGLAPLFLKTYGFDRIARGNTRLRDMYREAEKNGGRGSAFERYLYFFPLTDDFDALDPIDQEDLEMYKGFGLRRLQPEKYGPNNTNKRDSKTGATSALVYSLRLLAEDDLLQKAYPAMLKIANSAGQKAGENLKDILIAMEYMKPEETGRDKEGMFSRFMGTGRKQRSQAADDIYAQIYDGDD